MDRDMCVQCDNGLIDIRTGAIILKDGKIFMVGNQKNDYFYSVGGRIKFGETAEQAVVREFFEETDVKMEITIGLCSLKLFFGDAPTNFGKLIYDISFI